MGGWGGGGARLILFGAPFLASQMMRMKDEYGCFKVKSMVNLVDDIAANALKSMVAGEELDTAAPLGGLLSFVSLVECLFVCC